jgi:FtsH-binding integral membrane protein
MIVEVLSEILIVSTFAALLLFSFESENSNKKWTLLCAILGIGLMSYCLGGLIDLPISFTSYILLAILLRTALFIIILKIFGAVFHLKNHQDFQNLFVPGLLTAILGSVVSFFYRI